MEETNKMLLLLSNLERIAAKRGIDYLAIRKEGLVTIKVRNHVWNVPLTRALQMFERE